MSRCDASDSPSASCSLSSRSAAPSPSRDASADPLNALSVCHRHLAQEARALGELARRIIPAVERGGAVDDAMRADAESVLLCFDTLAPDLYADEEADLFPALIESMAGSDPVCLREMTTGLTAEHRELDIGWHRLREPLAEIAAGRMPAHAPDEAVVAQWLALCDRHLAREDEELLPMAARLIDDATLARIGRSMRDRLRDRAADEVRSTGR
ncbi:MAG: hemerythrin domain-containing protein [Burkholderiaceae bacterium]